MNKEVFQRLFLPNETPNDEEYLKKLILGIIFELSREADDNTTLELIRGQIKDERCKIVAHDLFKHCTTANLAGFDVEELEDFYLVCTKAGFVHAFVSEGSFLKVQYDITCQPGKLIIEDDTKAQHALLIINYHNDLSADDIEKLMDLRTEGVDDDMVITWSALCDKNLPENTLRHDLLLCGD